MGVKTLKLAYVFSFGMLIISGLFHLLTYFPTNAYDNQLFIFVLTVATFPPFYIGIKSLKKEFAAQQIKNPHIAYQQVLSSVKEALSKNVIWVGIELVAYVFFNFFFSILFLNQGLGPDIVNGTYVLQDHGRIVKEITATEYALHRRYEMRGISGHPVLFQFIALNMIDWSLKKSKTPAD